MMRFLSLFPFTEGEDMIPNRYLTDTEIADIETRFTPERDYLPGQGQMLVGACPIHKRALTCYGKPAFWVAPTARLFCCRCEVWDEGAPESKQIVGNTIQLVQRMYGYGFRRACDFIKSLPDA
jgi:hypothetical protein